MNISLKPYQERAVEELINKSKKLLSDNGHKKVCVFQAPTGSGKTVVTGKYIEGLIKELSDQDICFVWVSIGKGELHLQSKRSLEKVFEGFPRLSLVEEEFSGGRDIIERNEMVVVNWEKIRTRDRKTGEWKNLLMKVGEKVNFPEVLDKTREKRKIILIIDESHIGRFSLRTEELLEVINADLIVEMSATPKFEPTAREIAQNLGDMVYVDPKEVIDEGMIKKELIINEGIDDITDDEKDSQQVVLEAAFKKREELKKLFAKTGSNINPLVLIQIPVAEAGQDKIQAIRSFLSRRGVSESNKKLAIWTAEQKSETLDWISEPDNEVEFLIFKQAIDTGWDCPRAHILVKFREIHTETFEIQTVGRILRMPEQKHYQYDDLNTGFIYTNVQSVIVKKEEYNPNIIKHLKADRKTAYKTLKLQSYYRSRIDYGDITSSFTPVFERVAMEMFKLDKRATFYDQNIKKLEKLGLILDLKQYQQSIISDAKIEGKTFDEIEGKIDAEALARLNIAGNDLQAAFEQFVKTNLGSFTNIKRSVSPVKSAIYNWFRKYLGSEKWPEEIVLIQKVVLHNGNQTHFQRALNQAIEAYKAVREKEIEDRAKENEQYYDFDIQEKAFYNQHTDEVVKHDGYVYNPCYLDVGRSQPEKSFESFLEKESKNITWWWKNGEKKIEYFGIRYEYPTGIVRTFYPDYLVQFKDGRLGIFEVKDAGDRDGTTLTKAKAETLQEYISKDTKNTLNIFGGIVIERDGHWNINSNKIYNWSKVERGDWGEWSLINKGAKW